ncbi:hypothetical protein D1970_15765 [Mesobacillus zeae]|uniref:Uncharacterized protein n=1 Tax=Mesobacillus zeae TaxID=1917180 RepID=A0A398B0P1_9BACI|nr:hypothetical protein D1970_15765 [Mesobacillus zeae]
MLKFQGRLLSVLVTFLIANILIGTFMYFTFEKDIGTYFTTALMILAFLIPGTICGYIIDWMTMRLGWGKFLNYLCYFILSALFCLAFIITYFDMLIFCGGCSTLLWLTQQYFLRRQVNRVV